MARTRPKTTSPEGREARMAALARPAVRRIADVLRNAPQPLSAQEIADALGRHHSGVRTHLADLADAGVVDTVTDEPHGRGRPMTRYAMSPDHDGQAAAGHRELVRLLMGLIRRMGLDPDEVEGFAKAQAHAMPLRGSGPSEIRDVFARLGFAPVERPGPEPRDLVLHHCPFATGVEAPGGELICTLHLGLARGIAQVACPEIEVTRLIAEDPRTAGCRIVLSAPSRD